MFMKENNKNYGSLTSLTETEGYNSYTSEPNLHTRKPQAIITLKIGSKTEQISIFEGDDISHISSIFAKKHNLKEEFIEYLSENIKTQLKTHKKKPFSQPQPLSSFEQNPKPKPIEKNDLTQFEIKKDDSKFLNKSQSEIRYEYWQRLLQEKTSKNNNMVKSPLKSHTKPKKHDISKNSNRSISPIRTAQIVDKLYNEGKIIKERKNNAEKIKAEKEMEECSFHPSISPNSRKIAETNSFMFNNNPLDNIHKRLYKEGKEAVEKKEKWRNKEIEKTYKFNPEISNKSNHTRSQKDLIEKLVNSKKEIDKEIIFKKRDKIENNTFMPKINKDKYYYAAKEKENIEMENFNKQNITEKNIENNNNITEKNISIENKENYSISEEYIIILKTIFNDMDSDADGVIRANSINISDLDHSLLEILQDILIEMEEKNLSLNFGSFLNKIEQFHLEIKLHNWLSKNYQSFEKLNKLYDSVNPKHYSQFSFGNELDTVVQSFKKKEVESTEKKESKQNKFQLTSKYMDIIKGSFE